MSHLGLQSLLNKKQIFYKKTKNAEDQLPTLINYARLKYLKSLKQQNFKQIDQVNHLFQIIIFKLKIQFLNSKE